MKYILCFSQCSAAAQTGARDCQSPVYQGGSGTGRLIDTKHCGEQLETLQQPERGVSGSTRKRETDDLESQKA